MWQKLSGKWVGQGERSLVVPVGLLARLQTSSVYRLRAKATRRERGFISCAGSGSGFLNENRVVPTLFLDVLMELCPVVRFFFLIVGRIGVADHIGNPER